MRAEDTANEDRSNMMAQWRVGLLLACCFTCLLPFRRDNVALSVVAVGNQNFISRMAMEGVKVNYGAAIV